MSQDVTYPRRRTLAVLCGWLASAWLACGFEAAAWQVGHYDPEEAPAEEPPPATFGDEIVVTATATERRAIDLPYAVETLAADELRRRQMARTLPEALDELPGIMVQKTAHGQGSPFVRGFTGFRNLLLVDGIRLNNSVFRDGPNQYWATVDPLALERLEVVKGPVSVLYGSDAIGGTVNALTSSPGSLLEEGDLGGSLSYRWASAEDSHSGRLAVAGGAGRLRLAAGVSGKDFGDLEAGGEVGRQPRTGYRQRDADLKGELDLERGRQLVAGFQRTAVDDAWRSHRTVFAVPWRGTTVGDEKRRSLDQRRELVYLQYLQELETPFFDRLHANLSYHRQAEERRRIRGDSRSDRQGFEVGTAGLWLRCEEAALRGLWSYGLELYRDRVDSFARRFDTAGELARIAVQGPVADDAGYDLWGVYLQREQALGERLRLTVGGRYNRAEAEARRVEDPITGRPIAIRGSWDKVVGNARLLYRRGDWALFAGVSQGFRAPNLSDLTRFDSARSNEIETPSPDLEPESFLAWELGWRVARAAYSAQVSLFHTDASGLITRVPTGRVLDGEQEVTKKNGGDGFVRGFEGQLRVRLGGGFSLFSAYTRLDGEAGVFLADPAAAVREPFDRLMPATGHLGLRWDGRRDRRFLELVLTVAERQDRLSSRDRSDTQRIPPGGTPGYRVLTLRGGRSWASGVTLDAAVENLTDEEYRVHGSGLNQAGRNLVLALRLAF